MLLHRLRRLRSEGGYTLIELTMVLAILGVVVGALTTLFVSAMNAEVDANRRFKSQQDARVAVDKMRREIHCSSGITPAGASASISVSLPAQCPSAGGSATTVTYDVVGSGQRFQLRRNSVVLADYVTEQNAFNYTAPVTGTSLGKLRVTLPINIQPSNGLKEWRLVGDIVLRNTTR
ncbi:MAG TPA: type II secretion system protein [Actinomycetes bacterium]|nr:type II secretion system protein [Actinomycetes bacterium]